MRDAGLLKLYFGSLLSPADVMAMARRERDLHRRRLTTYETIQAELAHEPAARFAAATLRMGLAYEQMSITFWEDVAKAPPATPATPDGATAR
jgi:hypothetical protein